MRFPFVLFVGCALAACGGRPAPLDRARDASAADDGAARDAGRRDGPAPPGDGPRRPDGGLDFCQGAPRLELNGTDLPTAVEGRMVFMDCCEAAEFVFTPVDDAGRRVVVVWQSFAGPSPGLPLSADLANLPPGLEVRVLAGCEEPLEYCFAPKDSYEAGLKGSLVVTGTTPFYDYRMTLCLAVAEDAASPHPLMHSVRLWADGVIAPYPDY